MRIMFDSNAWQRVIRPDKFKKDPRHLDFLTIRRAIEAKALSGYISETVATLEGIPKKDRPKYLETRPSPITITHERTSNSNEIHSTVKIAAKPGSHPGLAPILSDRIREAIDLGFKIVPVPRLGISRPSELERKDVLIPLTDDQNANIWPLLERIAEVSDAIEARECGRMVLETIAKRMRCRIDIPEAAWFDGLGQAANAPEINEISAAFAEWADADSVAVHVGYELDAFCTEDFGKTAGKSVLNGENRKWLSSTYGVIFLTLHELADQIRAGK